MKNIKYTVELTDTFGGEANYSWVKRKTLIVPDTITDLALIRRAKSALGISGERTTTEDYGDTITVRFPRHTCMLAFITPQD